MVAPWLPQHPVAALGCAYLAAAAIAAGVGLAPVEVPLGARGALVRAVGGAEAVYLCRQLILSRLKCLPSWKNSKPKPLSFSDH